MPNTRLRRGAATVLAGGLAVLLLPAAQPILSAAGAGTALVPVALAQTAPDSFVRALGDKMVGVVNGSASLAEKKSQIQPMLDQNVDVDGIGRFCLGRYWRTATPDQQQRYLTLFHKVLVNSITGKLGEYKGVTFQVGSTRQQDGKSYVTTVITRPGQPAANVEWVVDNVGGTQKITDVVAEGVSLSLTQRSDYASYLARNGNSVDALLNALQRQVSRQS